MRLVPLFRWIATATIVAGMASQVLPCQCSQQFYIGKTFWQAAQLRSEGPTVIFEGTLAKVQVRWNALDAKDGEMFSANPEEKNPGDKQVPHLIVTFRVQRAYQGILGPEVQVRTGLGGGDCGARFAPGLIYLVYASKLSDGELGVSTCSPGGWVGNESVQVDLRYLRKERPTNSDLEPWRPWSATKPTNLEHLPWTCP